MPPKKASRKAKSGNATAQKARRDYLAERNNERKLLGDMLALDDRGGLSAERALALQAVFRKKVVPIGEEAIQKDKLDRQNGLLEMSCARFRCLKKQEMDVDEQAIQPLTKPEDRVEKMPKNALGMPLETVDISQTPFVTLLKQQREQEAAEEAAHRDLVRDYYKGRPFPEKSGEWEDV